MNLLELLHDELKGKHYTEFEKVRYVYLRLCQIFSFDSKWRFAKIFNDVELLEKLQYKNFDIENIEEYLVVCHSFSRSILKPILEELTNLEFMLEESEHTSVKLQYGPNKWDLDATLGDFARVKAGLKTNGFDCINKYSDKIVDEIDKELGYIRYDRDYYINQIVGDNSTEKILSIGRMLSKSDCKYHYSDASFYYSVFKRICDQFDLAYANEDYNIYKLIKVISESTYFKMYRKNDVYEIKQIYEDEYNVLKRTLKSE